MQEDIPLLFLVCAFVWNFAYKNMADWEAEVCSQVLFLYKIKVWTKNFSLKLEVWTNKHGRQKPTNI
jgi:hypothetical protein